MGASNLFAKGVAAEVGAGRNKDGGAIVYEQNVAPMISPRGEDQEHIVEKDTLDYLKSLHTSEIDARNGYEEALEDAEGRGLTPLFRDMVVLHDGNAHEIERVLTDAGEKPSSDGSFMSVIHRTIMNVRSLFDALGDGVLPGLIDGEKRNVEKYDKALSTAAFPGPIGQLLTAQRNRIQERIALMETERADSLQH